MFHEGIPDSEMLPKWFSKGGVLLLDDLMDEGTNDKGVLDVFTKHSHHKVNWTSTNRHIGCHLLSGYQGTRRHGGCTS